MRSKQLRILRRFGSLLGCLVASAALATGCGNDGGAGDGVIDASGGAPPQAGAPSAGKSGGKAGSASSFAGSAGKAGSSGASGAVGASGAAGASGAGGASGSAGASGNGGAAGKAGAGTGGGNNGGSAGNSGGTAGMAAGSGAAGMSAGTGGGGSLTCGNGTVETGETCDVPKSDADNYGVLCSNTCYTVGTKACVDCENADACAEQIHNCAGPAAKPFTEPQIAACFAVMRCVQKSNCLDGTGSLGKCYCGTLDTGKCGAAPFTGAGSPDGACVKEIQAGMLDVTTNTAALGGLTTPVRPAGAAMQRLNCQKVSLNNGATCAIPCGFTPNGPAFP